VPKQSQKRNYLTNKQRMNYKMTLRIIKMGVRERGPEKERALLGEREQAGAMCALPDQYKYINTPYI